MTSVVHVSSEADGSSVKYETDSFESQSDWSNSASAMPSSLAAGSGPVDSQRAEDSHSGVSLSSCCEEGTNPSIDVLQRYMKRFTMEEELRAKWIRALWSKANRPVSTQNQRAECCQPVRGSRTSRPQESSASRAYCQEKMTLFKALRHANPPSHRTQGGERGSRQKPTGTPPDLCVPQQFITTLQLKSFTEGLKQIPAVNKSRDLTVLLSFHRLRGSGWTNGSDLQQDFWSQLCSLAEAAEADMHRPSHCSACEDQRAKLALHTFLRTRRTLLESRQLENKLQLHLYNYNSICLVGELLRNLPKTSDEPDKILQALVTKERWSSEQETKE